jgi:predicted acyltransferase
MSDQIQAQSLSSQRLISLDALRGFTIAGMVIVNDPGSWSHVYPPLQHASWHGLTFTDLIFPFFLYIVGVSIAFAYTKRMDANLPKKDIYKKIIWRAIKIFAVGMLLRLIPDFDFSNLRWAGVLQRIALVFLVCALLFLNTSWRRQVWIGTIILVGYWILMTFIPVPIDDVIRQSLETGTVMRSHGDIAVGGLKQISDGFIAANYHPGVNIVSWFDRIFLPGRFYEKTWDPEGLMSTLPALVTCIIGMLVGRYILTEKDMNKKLVMLFFAGLMMLIGGELWSYIFPLNKNLWTSSFVLYTGGAATMGLAALILVVDIWGYTRWTQLGQVYGANAITSYVLAGILTTVFYDDIWWGISFSRSFMEGMTGIGVAPKLASFMYAIIYMLIIYVPAYILYKRKIFIKL